MQTITQENMAEAFSMDFTKNVFPQLWKHIRQEFEESSKKELAEDMFYAGAINMLCLLQTLLEEERGEEEWQ